MPPAPFDGITGTPATSPSGGVQVGSGNTGRFRAPAYAAPVPRNVAAVEAAVEQIREHLASSSRRLEFQADAVTGLVNVTIKDAESGQIIREIPGNAVLSFAELLTRTDRPRALVDLTA
ncbi:MAG TPA: flagellar protein FlaG [Steroidobacteraceae bacterium]|nr:flagellar protein FlaG [Steroidobacteraceae bacterium]